MSLLKMAYERLGQKHKKEFSHGFLQENKNSLSDRKKLVFLSLIALLQHLPTMAIEGNERIG